MNQGFELNHIQYLMVFLRKMPSIGLEEFERRFIDFANFKSTGSRETRLYRDFFGEDTKIKVLITGEIELSEKNILIGLKMAFPEWEFELFPMSIQKLFLKDTDGLGTKEAGAIAMIEPTIRMEKVEWGEPCTFDLSQEASGGLFNPILKDDFIPEPKVIKSDVPRLEEQLEKFKDIWTRDFYDEERKPNEKEIPEIPEEKIENVLNDVFSDLTDLPDEEFEASWDENFKEVPFYQPKPHKYPTGLDPDPDPLPDDNLTGADSEEILEQFGARKPLWPFSDSLEDESNIPTFTAGDFKDKGSFNNVDLAENSIQEDVFLDQEYSQAHPSLPPDFNGTKHEFEMLGVVEENPTDDLRTSMGIHEGLDQQASFIHTLSDKSGDVLNSLLDKLVDFPSKKIGKPLLLLGVALFALSFGVKFLEPDYETSRKAAGVMDVYEWIIANDKLGEETNEVFEAWDNSVEGLQFWAWYDTQWSPKISIFHTVEGGLRKVGILLALCGIFAFTITIVAKQIATRNEYDADQILYSEDKRISLHFTIYNDTWPLVDKWSKEYKFKILEAEGSRRLYRKAGNLSHPPILCMIACSENEVSLEVWPSTWIPTPLIPIFSDLGIDALEAKNTVLPREIKTQINTLLTRLGHPPIA
jgi:hypothetical protein